MTSGSVWTHLIVTSGAPVEKGEQRVALARVAREPAVPLEDGDRLVDGLVDRGLRARVDDGAGGAPQPLAQRDDVIHRDLALAIAHRDEVGERGHRPRVAA